jgi:predicted nucleic acid-binding protein
MVGAYMLQGPNHTPDEFVSELGNVKRLFADLTAVYPVTDETTALYGRLQAQLILQGKRKLTINDGWIAATALEHRLTLVTSDQRLKDLGDLLRIEDWRV